MLLAAMPPFNDTNHPNTSAAVFKAFPEIKEYYGDAAVIEMQLDYTGDHSTADYDQITINTKEGIEVGDAAKGGLQMSMTISASNATTPKEVAAEFAFGSSMSLNFTLDNFVIYKTFGKSVAQNVVLKSSTITFAT
jgi:hypothetical protein